VQQSHNIDENILYLAGVVILKRDTQGFIFLRSKMKKQLYALAIFPILLSGCGMINQTTRALEWNQHAIDINTQAIDENSQAIEGANASLAENQRQLNAINQTLKKINESESSTQEKK